MCIINFHVNEHPNYKLIVVANRDEFYKRPTAAAHFWEDAPELLAGRDLEAKGTWLGITKTGKFAALTNIRDASIQKAFPTSRGDIVTNFLLSEQQAEDYLTDLVKKSNEYAGFNVLAGSIDELYYLNNRENEVIQVEDGTHSLSNHFLNTPWPKVCRARKHLNEYVMNNKEMKHEELFEIAMDRTKASDEELPNTGISLELERELSSLFIQTLDYGTRSITVLTIDKYNHVKLTEKSFDKGEFSSEKTFSFTIIQ
ncbi:MAG TPA: NRDE family protein [Bacillota bacterium]|nr:NRDE family protein [Bacillota bacterium]